MIKPAILLTACVNPQGMSFTKIQDSKIRENQYKNALKWYLENTKEKIVFVENTMCDFSSEFNNYIESGRVEFITFDGNNFDKTLGKGYGEALIIESAISKSKLLKECNLVIKITGRVKIINIQKIIRSIKSEKTIHANTNITNGHAVCQSVIFIAPLSFLKKYFIINKNLINDSKGYYFEHLLYDSMIKWKIDGGYHTDFHHPLLFDGVSGSTGKPYANSKNFKRLKAFIKYYFHKHGIYFNQFMSY